MFSRTKTPPPPPAPIKKVPYFNSGKPAVDRARTLQWKFEHDMGYYVGIKEILVVLLDAVVELGEP